MVDGYETESQRASRLTSEARDRAAAADEVAKQQKARAASLLPIALESLRASKNPDCMVEIVKPKRFRVSQPFPPGIWASSSPAAASTTKGRGTTRPHLLKST